MNIRLVGQSRFRILSTHNRYPYLERHRGRLPDREPRRCAILSLVSRLTPQIKRYLDIFAALGEVEFKMDQLPDDPEMLAYLTAIVLNVPPINKQRILEISQLPEMLSAEYALIRREALFLQHIVERGSRWRDDPNPLLAQLTCQLAPMPVTNITCCRAPKAIHSCRF